MVGPDRLFADEGYAGMKRDARAGLDHPTTVLRPGHAVRADTFVVVIANPWRTSADRR